MRNTAVAGASIFSVALVGCGGGDASAVPQDTTLLQGIYTGTTSNGRSFTGLLFDDGAYYFFYSAERKSELIGGFVQGTATASNGSFNSSDARDINLEGAGVLSATVSASYVPSISLNGTFTYPSLKQELTFMSTYDRKSEVVSTLATIAGSYSGSVVSPLGTENATITVGISGAVVGRGSSGCTFSGSITPRSKGNAYNVTIAFGGALCLFPNTAVTGGAYFDAPTNRLYAVGLKADRDTGFIFSGVKA